MTKIKGEEDMPPWDILISGIQVFSMNELNLTIPVFLN
jgi:hypothetical protein